MQKLQQNKNFFDYYEPFAALLCLTLLATQQWRNKICITDCFFNENPTFIFWFSSQILSYSISQDICTRFLLCCALLWLYIDSFSHIHQAYFTGTVAI